MRFSTIARSVFKILMITVSLTFCGALANAEPPATKSKPKGGRPMLSSPPSADLLALGEANTRFALDVYSKLKGEPGNLFFSPYSISTALAMTAVGARGETLEQMTATLHLPKDSEVANKSFKDLIDRINRAESGDAPAYQLKTANALWGQTGLDLLPEFLKITQQDYGAGLREVDFQHATESARVTINDWVAKQTNDKLRDLLKGGTITPQTSLVLTNAIYFLGNWSDPFRESSTRLDTPFHSPNGEKKVAMMSREASYAYAETPEFQAIEIPYAGGPLAMVVLLPKSNDGLPALETLLADPSVLQKTLKSFKHVPVKLEFPKFKLTESIDLSGLLASLGMTLAFDADKADFSGICSQRKLWISQVLHKAFVDVNEKGTEAAAATAVVMMARSAFVRNPVAPVEFKADHPFIFMIRDRDADSLLFLGRVVEPGKD